MTRAHIVLVIITLLLQCTVDAQVLRGTVIGPTGPSGVNGFGAAIVAVKDVDGDGAMDFAVSDPSHFAVQGFLMPPSGRVWVYSGSSLQLISTLDPTAGQTGFASTLRSAGDADGNGNGDLIVGGLGLPTSLFLPFTQQRIVVSIQPPATLRTFTTATSNINLTVNNLNVWSIGDRNGDGRDDIAVRGTSISTIFTGLGAMTTVTDSLSFRDVISNAVYFSESRIGPNTIVAGEFALDGLALDDLDGDGLAESIFSSRTPTLDSRIRLSSGTTRVHPIPWTRFGRFDDLDGDGIGDYGDLDLGAGPFINPSFLNVFSGATGCPVYVRVFPGGEIATTMAEVHGVGDVNRDGLGDYAVSDVTVAFLLRVYSGRDGSEIMTVMPPTGMTFSSRFDHLGDIDGDGIQEIVIGDRNLPQAYVYSLVPAGVTYFGTGCPSIGGVGPTLGVTGQALAGSGVDFHLGNVPPFGLGVLIIGVSNTFWGPIILPYDLGVIGLPGCDLLVSADFLDFALIDAVGQKGTASFGYTFAAGLPLTGFTFFGQWFVENPPGSPLPIQMSNAASVTFQ